MLAHTVGHTPNKDQSQELKTREPKLCKIRTSKVSSTKNSYLRTCFFTVNFYVGECREQTMLTWAIKDTYKDHNLEALETICGCCLPIA